MEMTSEEGRGRRKERGNGRLRTGNRNMADFPAATTKTTGRRPAIAEISIFYRKTGPLKWLNRTMASQL